jgi:hypothetical protein
MPRWLAEHLYCMRKTFCERMFVESPLIEKPVG